MMNGKWYSIGIEEAEKILKTNAASGLTRRAARSRAARSGGNSFFFVGTKSLISCFWSVISDPMLLLLIGIDIIAAVFGEKSVAISAGVLILINILVTFVAYLRSQRIIESMSGFSQPKVRVIRDGKLYLADSRAIVPGDVILLSEGDILPGDARIINCHDLEMRVYTGKNRDLVVTHPNGASVYDPSSNLEFYEYENMLYAGSVVMSGEARALVVETGETTYIGALEGGIQLNEKDQRSEYLRQMKRFSSIYGFCVLIMILPLTVVGIISYGSDSLLSTFMLTLSLAVSSLGELIYVIGNISTAASIYDSAAKRGKHDRAIIRSAGRASVLAATDRIILIGNAALTDGVKRVSSVYVGGRELCGKEMFKSEALRLGEYATMLDRTAKAFPSLSGESFGLPEGLDRFCDRLGVDTQAISIRTKPLGFTSGQRMTASVNDCDRIVTVIAGRDETLIDICSSEMILGESRVLGSEQKISAKKAYRAMVAAGNEAFVVTTTVGAATVLEGILSFTTAISPAISESISELRLAGVETTLVLDGDGSYERAMAFNSGIVSSLAQIASAAEYKKAGKSFNDIPETCPAILGFSVREVREYIEKLRSAGHTVTVFATSAKSYPEFVGGNVTATCDREDYSAFLTSNDRQLDLTAPSGAEQSPDGAQLLRFSADILVKRADLKGGGVVGLKNAIAAARRLQKNLTRAVSYLLCTQLARLSFVIPAIICGRELLSPFQLLFSGLVIDMGAMLILALDTRSESVLKQKYRSFSLKNPIKNCFGILSVVGASALLGAVAAILISFTTKAAVSGAVFTSLITMQLMLLSMFRYEGKPKKLFTPLFISELAVCAAVILLCGIIPTLSTLTGTEFSLMSLIALPIAPIMLALWRPIRSLIFKRSIKK